MRDLISGFKTEDQMRDHVLREINTTEDQMRDHVLREINTTEDQMRDHVLREFSANWMVFLVFFSFFLASALFLYMMRTYKVPVHHAQ